MAGDDIAIEDLKAKGYELRPFKTRDLTYYRWHLGERRGGGYLTASEVWREAEQHCRLTAERAKAAH